TGSYIGSVIQFLGLVQDSCTGLRTDPGSRMQSAVNRPNGNAQEPRNLLNTGGAGAFLFHRRY
ncbi:MAG TPA: hypothetical protein VME23_15630, partial [Terracidiphilus sp.]|nr:hypothetical protein [Terracidiphilus sp.]